MMSVEIFEGEFRRYVIFVALEEGEDIAALRAVIHVFAYALAGVM